MYDTSKKYNCDCCFGNLFSSSNKPTKRSPSGTGSATLKYNAPTSQVRPVGDPNRKERDQYSLGDKSKAYDFMQDEIVNEKSRREREQERKEQYRQVRAHVRKEEDGRLQAYGWSLPAKLGPSPGRDPSRPAHAPVPVPVYCRPLLEDDPDMKLWCAAGLNMSGGWTKDGGVIVGASVFYSRPPSGDATQLQAADNDDDIDKIDQELKDHERSLNEMENEKRSSVIWISTTSHNQSRITIIDANCPADVLEAFPAASSHILCIASVPGAIASDYPSVVDDVVPADSAPDTTTAAETGPVDAAAAADAAGSDADTGSDTGTDAGSSGAAAGAGLIGAVSFVQCATGVTTRTQERADAERADVERADTERADATQAAAVETEEKNGDETTTEPAESPSDVLKVTKATGSPAAHAPTGTGPVPAGTAEPARAGIATATGDGVTSGGPQATSVLPTVWFGSQSGSLYVHSAVSQWKTCLHSVKLTDSILSIIHVKGRVFVGLADGTVAVFQRDSDGLWQLSNYHLIDLGKPHHAIRCMCVVANKTVWCAYRNIVHVIDPNTLKLQKTFSVHPRRESQVRQMAWVGDGVWLSIRLDSTLRLYHAYTHQHLQDVDIEPYVSKMLGTGKLGFSFVRITSLLTSYKRLWIGTGNGVIISIPLSEANKQAMTLATAGRPGGIVRVYGGDAPHDSVTPGSFIPYCSMAQAQLSFHGHRDAVKFFVAVPGAPSKGLSGVTAESGDTQDKGDDPKLTPASPVKNMLVLSGGEGYIDFRIGDAEEDPESPEEENTPPEERRRGEQSHIIVWQVAAPATPTVIASPPVTA